MANDLIQWRSVPGASLYEVSSCGKVRRGAQVLKQQNCNGYRSIRLRTDDGALKSFRVHRLVLFAFVGECPDGHECAHLNGKRADNRRSNLAWVTAKENAAHRISHGTQATRERHGSAKLTSEQVAEIRRRHIPFSHRYGARALAREYRLNRDTIDDIVNNRTWRL